MTQLNDKKAIELMFRFMEWDWLSDSQHDLIIDLEEHFRNHGSLSIDQYIKLERIFNEAASNTEGKYSQLDSNRFNN